MKVNLPPKPPLCTNLLCKLGGAEERGGGVVKNIDFVKKQSLTASRRSSLYTREPFFLLALGKISFMRQLRFQKPVSRPLRRSAPRFCSYVAKLRLQNASRFSLRVTPKNDNLTCHPERRKISGGCFSESNPTIGRATP